jgi:hypothetical protein
MLSSVGKVPGKAVLGDEERLGLFKKMRLAADER